jgi:class 3 adenylate cyclase
MRTGIHLLAPTAQDTLDFTGPAMNTGSRLILVATDGGSPVRGKTARQVPEPLTCTRMCATRRPWGRPF